MRKYSGTPYKIRLPNCLQHQTFMKLNYSLLKMRNLSASNKMNTLQTRQRMVNADFYFLHLFPPIFPSYMKTALLKKSTPILRELTNVTTCIFISINVPLTLEHLAFPSLATSELQNLMGFKSLFNLGHDFRLEIMI